MKRKETDYLKFYENKQKSKPMLKDNEYHNAQTFKTVNLVDIFLCIECCRNISNKSTCPVCRGLKDAKEFKITPPTKEEKEAKKGIRLEARRKKEEEQKRIDYNLANTGPEREKRRAEKREEKKEKIAVNAAEIARKRTIRIGNQRVREQKAREEKADLKAKRLAEDLKYKKDYQFTLYIDKSYKIAVVKKNINFSKFCRDAVREKIERDFKRKV
jgi:hypothetical protein